MTSFNRYLPRIGAFWVKKTKSVLAWAEEPSVCAKLVTLRNQPIAAASIHVKIQDKHVKCVFCLKILTIDKSALITYSYIGVNYQWFYLFA